MPCAMRRLGTRAQYLVYGDEESCVQCRDWLLHQEEGLGMARYHSSNKTDARAGCLEMDVIQIREHI